MLRAPARDGNRFLREKAVVHLPQGSVNFVLCQNPVPPKRASDIQWYLAKSEKSQSCEGCSCRFSPWQVSGSSYIRKAFLIFFRYFRFMQSGILLTLLSI